MAYNSLHSTFNVKYAGKELTHSTISRFCYYLARIKIYLRHSEQKLKQLRNSLVFRVMDFREGVTKVCRRNSFEMKYFGFSTKLN